MIHVYNLNTEDFSKYKNNYNIGRPNILSNPYTYLDLEKTKATFQCKTREEAIDLYSNYFDVMYSGNIEFQKVIDEIYEKYKNGEEIYLGCWCSPKPCHGDIIKKKLEERLIRERFKGCKIKRQS